MFKLLFIKTVVAQWSVILKITFDIRTDITRNNEDIRKKCGIYVCKKYYRLKYELIQEIGTLI